MYPVALFVFKVAIAGLYLFFVLGQMAYVLKRAGMAIRSKTNPLKTRWQYVELWWDIILLRAGVELCLFWLYVSYPSALTTIAAKAHISWDLTFPLVPPVAFLIGLGADWGLDWFIEWISAKFPKLKREVSEIPQIPEPNGQSKDAAVAGGN